MTPRSVSELPMSVVEEEERQLESLVYASRKECGCSARDVRLLEAECADGRRFSCFAAATQYRHGCGVEHDRAAEERLYGAACRLGSRVGCELEATAISDHGGDPNRGLALLEATCNRGYAPACGHLGVLLWTSKRDKSVVVRGVGLIERACMSGGTAAHYCSRLGTVVGESQDHDRFEKVRTLMLKACASGYLDSCHVLGIALEDGTLGVSDAVEAGRLQATACARGYLMACNALGYMCAKGNGTPKDTAAAYNLFAHACKEGFIPACDSVAEAIEKGWGVDVDPVKALEFYEYACRMGNVSSCDTVRARKAVPSALPVPTVPTPSTPVSSEVPGLSGTRPD